MTSCIHFTACLYDMNDMFLVCSASDRKKIPLSRTRPDLTGGVGGGSSEKTGSFSIEKEKSHLFNPIFSPS
jgi:hypothetical protein